MSAVCDLSDEESPVQRLAMIPLLTFVTLCSTGCPPAATQQLPGWTRTLVEYGQGSLDLGVRFRWVAVRDPMGARVTTPDGGTALVHVFNCGKTSGAVKALVRSRLRGRLIGGTLADEGGRGRVFAWRWRTSGTTGDVYGTAVQLHGPLLISFTSKTIQLDDLEVMARRAKLVLPVPTIPGCYPLCLGREEQCKPRSPEL